MNRRTCLGTIASLVTIVGCGLSTAEGDTDAAAAAGASSSGQRVDGGTTAAAAPLVVRSMANIGDSISQGFDADDSAPVDMGKAFTDSSAVFQDEPQYSWVQGTEARVSSVDAHYLSLDDGLTLTPVSHSGAELVGKITDIPNFEEQAQLLIDKATQPDLVFVLLGGNDVCNRPKSDGDPTAKLYSVDEWTAAADRGLGVLAAGLSAGATVRVLSMPRVDRLYAEAVDADVPMKYPFGSTVAKCKDFWNTVQAAGHGVCPIVTTESNPDRLAAIGERIDAYNDALASEVRRFAKDASLNPKGIRFQSDWHGSLDHGGTENTSMGTYAFEATLVSKRDCFHPSIKGQAAIANMVLNIANWE